MPEQLYRLTWADYMRLCIGKAKKDIERLREIRMIGAFITGKLPRQLFSLPGDYDHIPIRTHEERMDLAKKFGVYEKWGLNKN